jgi:hypothetical protein
MSGYTLRFSDPTNTATVLVPPMPPGINTVDTSLSLVGRGYPNYGEKYAQNFLSLLENFSGPIPPENPIQGQLWYDTSDPNRKTLRIMDGSSTLTRWPSATGIYQQGTDPKTYGAAALKNGDLWVDTAFNQLKLFSDNEWITVGPYAGGDEQSGITVERLTDASDTSIKHDCVFTWAQGNVVSITSTATINSYIPVYEGFDNIKPGINLSTSTFDVSGTLLKFQGTATSAEKLGEYAASAYLRKNDTVANGQLVTGSFIYVTNSDQSGAKGRDGVVVRIDGTPSTEYVQFYKESNDAVVYNNKSGGKFLVKLLGDSNPIVDVDLNLIGLKKNTRVTGNFTVTNTASVASLMVSGVTSLAGNVSVSGNISLSGVTTSTNTLFVNNIRATTSTNSIGTKSSPFGDIHAVNVYAHNYYSSTGTLRLFAGSTLTNYPPDGWMFCTGTSLNSSTYIDLYNVIHRDYGGTHPFYNIPDLYIDMGGIKTYYIIKVE